MFNFLFCLLLPSYDHIDEGVFLACHISTLPPLSLQDEESINAFLFLVLVNEICALFIFVYELGSLPKLFLTLLLLNQLLFHLTL